MRRVLYLLEFAGLVVGAVFLICSQLGNGRNRFQFDQLHSLEEFQSRLFEDLSHDAAMYVCKVKTIEPVANYPRTGFEAGQVTVDVLETLWGPPRSVMTLPYVFPNWSGPDLVQERHNWYYPWEILRHLPDGRMLCVLDKEHLNRWTAANLPGLTNEVTDVYTAPDAAFLKAIRERIQLYRRTQNNYQPGQSNSGSDPGSDLMQYLRDHLEAPSADLRYFTLQILYVHAAALPQAIEPLQAHCGKIQPGSDITVELRFLSFLWYQLVHSPGADISFLARCLITLAESDHDTLREHALQTLAAMLRVNQFFPTRAHLLAELPPAEKASLKRMAEAELPKPRHATPAHPSQPWTLDEPAWELRGLGTAEAHRPMGPDLTKGDLQLILGELGS